jgi:hypothetical protein
MKHQFGLTCPDEPRDQLRNDGRGRPGARWTLQIQVLIDRDRRGRCADHEAILRDARIQGRRIAHPGQIRIAIRGVILTTPTLMATSTPMRIAASAPAPSCQVRFERRLDGASLSGIRRSRASASSRPT